MINDYICIKPSVNMITNIGYTEKNQLSLRKRYEIKKFHNLKNIKNFFKKKMKKRLGIQCFFKISVFLD